MFTPGLVSVSFRDRTVEELIAACKAAGLQVIEWGSDVHAPCTDLVRVTEIARLTKEAGLSCCSYGTYFRIGKNAPEELLTYIQAAKLLGTKILRLWCGTKGYAEFTAEEKEELFATCRRLAQLAAEQDVTLCMECHNNTFTDTLVGAKELMQAVQSPHFGMYWQPNQLRTPEENVKYAREIAPYVTVIHAFYWKGSEKFPLAEGKDCWQQYLRQFSGDHPILLEFMPDNQLSTLLREAEALRALL